MKENPYVFTVVGKYVIAECEGYQLPVVYRVLEEEEEDIDHAFITLRVYHDNRNWYVYGDYKAGIVHPHSGSFKSAFSTIDKLFTSYHQKAEYVVLVDKWRSGEAVPEF